MVQAWAARARPHVDMNPVLLKPGGENGSQVVLLGRPWKNTDARTYYAEAFSLREAAFGSLQRLRQHYDCVVMEGAGSCAEVNLRSREFVNFPAAHAADASVVLVADIERGGVFAQIVGSLAVMPPEDRERVVGFIVNRFRGDRSLFDDGVTYLEEQTGLPVFGVVPFVHQLGIDSEDSLRPDAPLDPSAFQKTEDAIRVAVIRFPHVSNATDVDALMGLESVEVHFLSRARPLGEYDLVLLPGSKNVRFDLSWFRDQGWAQHLEAYRRDGGRVGGICGGYQMMGQEIHDPHGIEGPPGSTKGLGLLPVTTAMSSMKILGNVRGIWSRNGAEVTGYEIHMGQTSVAVSQNEARGGTFGCAVSELSSDGPGDGRIYASHEDGVVGADGRLFGTYLHGLFDSPAFLVAFLSEVGKANTSQLASEVEERSAHRDRQLSLWADHLREHVDTDSLLNHLELK